MIVLLELLLIFFSSRYILQSLFALVHLITHSKKISIFFVTLLFFPGTIIHELSHFLVARILLLSTGRVSLFPHLQGETLKLGSVEVEKTDFVRSFFVGVAPLFGGIGALVGVMWYIQRNGMKLPFISQQYVVYILLGYVFFVIANNMFSSKKDFESMWKLLVIIGIVIGIAFLMLGQQKFMHQWIAINSQTSIRSVLKSLELVLLVPTLINIVLMGIFFLIRQRV